jgi:hypothetical protein
MPLSIFYQEYVILSLVLRCIEALWLHVSIVRIRGDGAHSEVKVQARE